MSVSIHVYFSPPDLDSLQLVHDLPHGEVVQHRHRARVVPHYPAPGRVQLLCVQRHLLIDLLLLQPGVQVVHHADVDDILREVCEYFSQLGSVIIVSGEAVGLRCVAGVIVVI